MRARYSFSFSKKQKCLAENEGFRRRDGPRVTEIVADTQNVKKDPRAGRGSGSDSQLPSELLLHRKKREAEAT